MKRAAIQAAKRGIRLAANRAFRPVRRVRLAAGPALAAASRPAALAAGIGALAAASAIIGYGSAKLDPYTSMQAAILAAILLPAIVLAMMESRKVIPYLVLIWAIAPEIRRVSDWLEGEFHSVTLLSAAPLLVSSVLVVPVLSRISKIQPGIRKLIVIPVLVLAYGAMLGLLKNGTGSLYDLANYIIPMLLIPYFAVIPYDRREQEKLVRSFAHTAILVAAYGIVQYLVVPPWDAFWMNHVEMNSIGLPYPLEIRVFSTLNSPGPAGMFMATALAPMIVEKKWRGPLGWLGVSIVSIGLLITLVRSAWVMLIVIVAVYTAISSGKQKWRLLAAIGVVSAMLVFLVPKLPGAEGLVARVNTMSDIQDDHSYNERLDFFHTVFPMLLSKPQGMGLGSIGVGTKLNNGGDLGEFGVFDNGFVGIFLTFGLIGGLLFFWTLWLLGKLLLSRRDEAIQSSIYQRLAAASLIGSVVCLIFENGYTGLRGFLQWMVVGLGVVTYESAARRRREDPNGTAAERQAGPHESAVRVP